MGFNTDGLTFNTLRGGNKARLGKFRNPKGELAHTKEDGSDWSPAQWLQAVLGELGEYANFRKKFERGDITLQEFAKNAAKELADVQTYLDILAMRCLDWDEVHSGTEHGKDGWQFIVTRHVHKDGVDLGQATMDKWNEVSRRVGVPIIIDAEDWHYVQDAPQPRKKL